MANKRKRWGFHSNLNSGDECFKDHDDHRGENQLHDSDFLYSTLFTKMSAQCEKVISVKMYLFAHLCLDMAEQFIVSARKYRPDSWSTVVGQKHITTTLQNAISTGQIAQAYLFTGPRGVGKTTCARIFAKAVNQKPSGEETDISFNVFELDAASNNSVDDIRSIVDSVRIPPQVGKYKVYIIDEVHMLSPSAFNAFLKTLEEPPAHAIFILATTEKHKIIPTILSRCQIFDFNRIKVKDISEHLAEISVKEGINAEPEALHVIAQKADGAMRDALSIFDQVVAFCGRNLRYQDVIQNLNVLDYDYYFKVVDFVLAEDIPGMLLLYNEVLDKGFDGHHFISGLGGHIRNLLVCKDEQTIALMEVSDGVAEKYRSQAAAADLRLLITCLDFINTCDVEYRTSKSPRLLVELTLMQLCSILYNRSEGEKKKFRLKPFRSQPPAQVPVKRAVPKATPEVKKIEPVAVEVTAEIATNESDSSENPSVSVAAPVRKTTSSVVGKSAMSKILSKSSDGLSLAALMEKKKEKGTTDAGREEIADDAGVNGTFEHAQFEMAWQEFANSMKGINMSLHSTLSKQPHEIDHKGKIQLFLANGVQEMEVTNIRSELIGFINQRMGIKGFSLNTIVLKHDEIKKVFLSQKEKFEAMVQKNPALQELRKKFNLNIDF